MTTSITTPDEHTKLIASVAAEQLGIKAVTLRKYSTLVEKQLADETRFRSADNRHRLYSPADLATFKTAIELTEQGTTLAAALAQTFKPAKQTEANRLNKSDDQTPPTQPAVQPQPTAPAQPVEPATPTQPTGPSNAELAKQQAIIIRRLDSLNYRLNLVLDRLDEQAHQQAAKPWWQFWRN